MKKSLEKTPACGFSTKVKGRIFRGVVVRKDDKYYAYQNLCQHLPISLDFNDDRYLNHEQTHLQCHMHGALYELHSGECVAGPCVGTQLIALKVREEETRLIVELPERFEE